MANFVFTKGQGRQIRLDAEGETFGILLLTATGTKVQLEGIATVDALIADPNTTECNFTNYTRRDLTVTPSEGTGTNSLSFADVTYTSAGAGDTGVAAVIYWKNGGSSATWVPVDHCDVSFTTNGNDLTISSPGSGFYSVAST